MMEQLGDALLVEQLEIVKEQMMLHTKNGDQYLNGSLDYLQKSGGKMLRPTLLLLGSRFGKKNKVDEIIKLATAIETIHLATLIHDDIIDEAQYRRGQLSIQGKYGQSYAVYMGDYLLSQCFLLLTHLDLEKELAIRLAKTVTKICVGDMKQNQMRYDTSITPFSYIKMVSGKTAALIAVGLSSGAYQAKANKDTVKLLGRIGYELGMAFQLMDDLLDYEGDLRSVGKDVQMDIIRGYYSMPVIFALQKKNEDSIRLKSLLESEEVEGSMDEIYGLIRQLGGVEATKAMAVRYHERAMSLMDQLPENDNKTTLYKLIEVLMKRMY